ncbi:MAG: Mu-like prophage major head subunit gpT family protein [Magnetococcales bacterium]|nr:Mu-like prophage major head subunit gpT family protein [Magnetococcales bacterium]
MPQSVLIEAMDGSRILVRAIQAGLSGNGTFYPDSVLQKAVPLFNGVRVMVKGDDEHLSRKGKDPRNILGRIQNAEFVEGSAPDTGEIRATLEMLQSTGDMGSRLIEAVSRGMGDMYGLSINAVGDTTPGKVAGKPARIARAINKIDSVDLIVEAGAGGRLVSLIEAQKEPSANGSDARARMLEALDGSRLPIAARERLEARFTGTDFVVDDVTRAIEMERDYLARTASGGRVSGLGSTRVKLIEGQGDKIGGMLDGLLTGAVGNGGTQSLREAYGRMTGDYRVTGRLDRANLSVMREALDSSSWSDVLGDAITRRMIADYAVNTPYDIWRKLVTTVPIHDFRTQERVRFGGYGDLPWVAEAATYLPLTSPGDEKATYAVGKRGGTEKLTLEMIRNDDVGALRQIPVKLSRSAKRTLGKFVLDFLRINPTIYDGKTLFHADHGNLGSQALSLTTWGAARLAMLSQTEKDSGDPLSIPPRMLLVPAALETEAHDLFRRNLNQDPTFLQSNAPEIVSVWYWTDANDWCAAADPADIASIEIGFLDGNQEPELFVQDSPTVGSLFTNDQITYKIRHVYGGAVTDYRGLHKAVVA